MNDCGVWDWVDPSNALALGVPRFALARSRQGTLDKSKIPLDCSPMQSFDYAFFTLLKTQSNEFDKSSRTSRYDQRTWKTITLTDLYKFFSMIVYMC